MGLHMQSHCSSPMETMRRTRPPGLSVNDSHQKDEGSCRKGFSSVAELYFFEELRTTLGEEASVRWLMDQRCSPHHSPPSSVTSSTLTRLSSSPSHFPVSPCSFLEDTPRKNEDGPGFNFEALPKSKSGSFKARMMGLMYTDAAHLVLQ